MNAKYLDLEGKNLNGYKPFYFQEVKLKGGHVTQLFFLTKPTPKGFMTIRSLTEEVEELTAKGITDFNTYKLTTGGFADSI